MSTSKKVVAQVQDTAISNFNTEISFNNKLEVSDVSDMVAVRLEDALLEKSAELKKEHGVLEKERTELQTELRDLVTKEVTKQKQSKEAKTLISALKAFNDKNNYTSSIYLQGTNIDDAEIMCKEKVSCDRNNTRHDREFAVKFTAKMNKVAEQIADCCTQLDTTRLDMESVMQQLGDLPRLKRRVGAKITEAQMAGEITDTKDILKLLEGLTTKPLPSKKINARIVKKG